MTDIKALEFKNASSSTVTFKNIDIGRTYYVGEVNADGEVILAGLAEDGTIFTANFNEGKSAVVKNADGSTTVVFENTFEEIPNGFYRSGKLNITKKLLGVDGKAMDSDETFYAGIFADAEYTELSGSVSENIVKLSLGGGSSVSASVDVVCDRWMWSFRSSGRRTEGRLERVSVIRSQLTMVRFRWMWITHLRT